MIQAVLFDVGGTLIKAYPSVGDIYHRVATRNKLKTDPHLLNSRFRTAWSKRKSNQGAINKDFWEDVVHEAFEPFQNPLDQKIFEDIYREFSEARCWQIYPDVEGVLKKLKTMNLKLAVASNWDERLPQLLEKLELSQYFDEQFISFYIGKPKPHPDFYAKCLKYLHLSPSQVIHIGDDVENDLEGAKKAGIRSFLIDRESKRTSPETLASLEEIFSRF